MAINKKIIDKYFDGSANPEEVSNVLFWLKGKEGQKYLSEKYDSDLQNLQSLEKSFNERGDLE